MELIVLFKSKYIPGQIKFQDPAKASIETLLHTNIAGLGLAPRIIVPPNDAPILITEQPITTMRAMLLNPKISSHQKLKWVARCMASISVLHSKDYYHGNPIVDNLVILQFLKLEEPLILPLQTLGFINFENSGNYPSEATKLRDYQLFCRSVQSLETLDRDSAYVVVIKEYVEGLLGHEGQNS